MKNHCYPDIRNSSKLKLLISLCFAWFVHIFTMNSQRINLTVSFTINMLYIVFSLRSYADGANICLSQFPISQAWHLNQLYKCQKCARLHCGFGFMPAVILFTIWLITAVMINKNIHKHLFLITFRLQPSIHSIKRNDNYIWPVIFQIFPHDTHCFRSLQF